MSISQVTELAQAFFPSPTDHVPCQRAPQLDFPQLTSLGHSLRLSLQVLFKTSSKYLPFNPEFDYIAIPSSTTCSGHFPVSSRSRRLPRDTSAQVSAARIVGTPPHALATGQIGSGCHLIQNSVVSQSQQQNSFRSFFECNRARPKPEFGRKLRSADLGNSRLCSRYWSQSFETPAI